jgi:hypothetical protein
MTGFQEVQQAIGYENIKTAIEAHVPPIHYDFKYDKDQWVAYVFSDDAQGQERGSTKAEALKKAYFNWLDVRLKAKDEQPADSDDLESMYRDDLIKMAEKLGFKSNKRYITKDDAIAYIREHSELEDDEAEGENGTAKDE